MRRWLFEFGTSPVSTHLRHAPNRSQARTSEMDRRVSRRARCPLLPVEHVGVIIQSATAVQFHVAEAPFVAPAGKYTSVAFRRDHSE